jgi:Uma2 family endonuclease
MFDAACRAGCFEDLRVELIGGRLVLMTESPEHRNTVHNVCDALALLLPAANWYIAREESVLFKGWRPLPDVAVHRGARKPRYERRLPRAADTALIAEVCESTYYKDRKDKFRRYASAQIPVYWIVNLDRRIVEVYSQPVKASYRDRRIFKEGQTVPVVIDGQTVGHVAVDDLLP